MWERGDQTEEVDTVLVTTRRPLTRGEATSRCDRIEDVLQTDAGERAPDPMPEGSGTDSCAAARQDSWLDFLHESASLTREVRLGPGSSITETTVDDARFGGEAVLWRGRDAARLMLSVPDGQVTPESAVEAVTVVLALRGTQLPDLPVARVLLAGYWNDTPGAGERTGADCDDGSCPGDATTYEYEHPDHRALTVAAPQIAAVAEAETWAAGDRTTADGDVLFARVQDYAVVSAP